MHRRDFYFRQLVAEGDMDEVFDLAEQADRDYVIDNGLVGVYFGLDVAEAGIPNLTVQVAGGSAYDQTGQRMAIAGTQVVDVSQDSNAVSTSVAGGGNSKIISVFLQFDRALSNPQNDGNNQLVQYDRDESFTLIVEQSNEGVGPTPPSLKTDAILLCDITRIFGQTTILNADLSTTRRQTAVKTTAGVYTIQSGRVGTAIGAMLTLFNTYVTTQAGNGGAAQIGYNGGPAWADASTNPAATVEAQLDKIVTDLAGVGGAGKIGNTAAGNIAAGTVQAALNELDTEKGGKATDNVWSGTNSWSNTSTFTGACNFSNTCTWTGISNFNEDANFSSGLFVTANIFSLGNTATAFLYGAVTFYADAGDRTVTYKLKSGSGDDEVTRHFEKYATGTPASITIDAPVTGHITRYCIEVLIVRQGSGTNSQTGTLRGTIRNIGGTVVLEGTSYTSSQGTEGGSPALAVSGSNAVVTLSLPANNMNIRLVVHAHAVKIAA